MEEQFTVVFLYNGNPDWKYIEDYIKSLPAGDKLENLYLIFHMDIGKS